MSTCPVCESREFVTAVTAARIEQEYRERERFVEERLVRSPEPDELKDLTDFFHQGKADIRACAGCGLLVRNEYEPAPARTYSDDEYDTNVMEHLYPRYLGAFRAKAEPYRNLLRPGAHVLEVGSHYGAFLQTAGEWGWLATGVDVGKDTARFARSKGFTVKTCDLLDCGFGKESFDGIFIWNCFDQIADPKPLVAECRRLLRPGGLLVIRTPNGLFYTMCQSILAATGMQRESKPAEFVMEAMAYNNLLGFPYLHGHSQSTLQRLVEPAGFRSEGMLNSELLTLPLPENPDWVEAEERMISEETRMLAHSLLADRSGVLTGPWIEVWFRSEREPLHR
jgi:2-polyprenyl-3-methyl-5-hydroxy-6-metoxy-1,4-benzoquinol methylase